MRSNGGEEEKYKYFIYAELIGDFSFDTVINVQKLESTNIYGFTGISVRGGLPWNSTRFSTFVRAYDRKIAAEWQTVPDGEGYYERDQLVDSSNHNGRLRLVREGNTVSAFYFNVTNEQWTLYISENIELSDTVYVTLFAAGAYAEAGSIEQTAGYFRDVQFADTAPTPIHTPVPTSEPEACQSGEKIVIPATSEGVTFTAHTDGIYRFTVIEGAYISEPTDHQNYLGWRSWLLGYKNRAISWSRGTSSQYCGFSPGDWDYDLGSGDGMDTYEMAESFVVGQYVDVPLTKNDYVIWIVDDSRNCYHDNDGEIYLCAQITYSGDWTPNPTPIPTVTPTLPPQAGDTITIPLSGLPSDAKPLEMVLIPAGTFTMGSPDDERGRYSREGPQHEVTITQAFYLGKYEVTQAQWELVMGSNPSSFKGKPNHPVETVSWDDCQSFIDKLNTLGEGEFRLPTEAEWEYACRAGTTTRFSFGDALECEDTGEVYCETADRYMWWSGNNTYGGNESGTKEVGQKLPNPWDLYDIHGNVYEWCNDRYGSYSSSSQTDPQGPTSDSTRVLRGGDWPRYTRGCRSAFRNGNSPGYRYDGIGLRLLRVAP